MAESQSLDDVRLSVSISSTRPPFPTLNHSPYSFSRSLQPPPSPLPLHPPPSPSHQPSSSTAAAVTSYSNTTTSPTNACNAFIARLHALHISTVVFDMDHTLTAAHSQGAIPASSLADYVGSLSPASTALLPLLLSHGFNVAIATFSDDLYTQSPSLFPFFFNPPTASPSASPAYFSGRPLVSALLSSFVKPDQLGSVITVALHPDLYTAATPTTSRVVVALPGRVRDMMRRRAAGGGGGSEEEIKDEGGLSDRDRSQRGEREETADDSGWLAETEQRERDDEPSASKTLVPMHMPEAAARRIPNFSPPPLPITMPMTERRTDEMRERETEASADSSWSWCCCFVSYAAPRTSAGRDARSSSVYNTPAHSPLPPDRPPPLTYQPPPLRIAPPMLPSPSPSSPLPSPSPPPPLSALPTPSASHRLRVTVREDDIVIEDRRYTKSDSSDKDEEESKERRLSHDTQQTSPALRPINNSSRPTHMLPHNRSLPTLFDHPETGYITRAVSEQATAAGVKSHGNPFADEAEEEAERTRKKSSNPFAEADEPKEKTAAPSPPQPPPPPPPPKLRPPPPRINTTPSPQSPPTSNPPANNNNSSPRSSSSSSGSMQSPPSLPANRPALPSLRVSTSHPSTPSGSSTSRQQSSPHTSSLQQPVPPTSAPSSHSLHFFPRTPKGSTKKQPAMPPIPPTPPVTMSPPSGAFVPSPPPPPPPPPPPSHAYLSPSGLSSHAAGGAGGSELYVNVSVAPASPPPLVGRMGGGGGGGTLNLPTSSPSFRPSASSVSASASSLMLPSAQLQASVPSIITLTSASANLNSNTSKHASYLNKLAALLPPPASAHPLYPLLSQYPPPPYKTAHMQLVRAVVMCRQRDRVEHSGRCKTKRAREGPSDADASKVCKCMMDSVPWSSMLLVDDVAENADSALQLGCHAVLVKGKTGLHFDDLNHILSPHKVTTPW